MWDFSRSRSSAAALAVMFIVACTGAHEDRTGAKTAGAATSHCQGLAILVEAVPPDSVSLQERCQLVRRALASLSRADSASGIRRGDTAVVTRAVVTPLSEETATGALLRATWHVSLYLDKRPYDAEVIFDRHTDSVKVQRIHKPLGSESSL